MSTLPSCQQCQMATFVYPVHCIDVNSASETDGQKNVCIVLMLTLPVKVMAKQRCMYSIDANYACETDGQTTMYALY